MSGKGAAVAALAVLCLWDLLRPRQRSIRSWSGKNPRRLHMRSIDVMIDGEWHRFPSYRSYRDYMRERRKNDSPANDPVRDDPSRDAFIDGRSLGIDSAAMVAHEMGHPDVRDAINALNRGRDAETEG